MTEKRRFSEIAVKAGEIIQKHNGSIADVDLMMRLDFAPDSWKVWKPYLIQMFSLRTCSHKDSDGEYHDYQIDYNKKEKKWEGKIIVLE